MQDKDTASPSDRHYYHIAVGTSRLVGSGVLTYHSPTPLQLGDIVEVPLRAQICLGTVWAALTGPEAGVSTRSITRRLPLPPLTKTHRDFLAWVAAYTLAPLHQVVRLALSVQFSEASLKPKALDELQASSMPRRADDDAVTSLGLTLQLNQQQTQAWDQLQDLVCQKSFVPIVLQGVTGSGKTEVYFKAMEAVLNLNTGPCLVLQPEINLTTDWVARFEHHFGFAPLLWHSNLTPKQRRETWLRVLFGTASVIVGARSALFLPFQQLGLVVVDEEHDTSYKQEEQMLYNARDMAVVRAKMTQCPVLLVSATPSLESLANVAAGKYHHSVMTERFGQGGMPTVRLVDMREASRELRSQGLALKRTLYLSGSAQEAIAATLHQRQQVLVFLNRRGYAPLTLCRSCGHRLQCPNCTAWLVEHRSPVCLQCHHCGHRKPYPEACPECGQKDTLAPCGPGVERLEEEIALLFPQATTVVMTSETLHNASEAAEKIKAITSGDVDIIIGTQVMAKGHTFPNLTLTVVVDGDLGLGTADLRASERTFQMLHQVGGRAGRADHPGSVVIQTFDPQHPLMQAIIAQDEAGFYAQEHARRQEAVLPPYGRLATLTLSAEQESAAKQACALLAKAQPKLPSGVRVLGPAPAMMARRKRHYRWRFMIMTPKVFPLQGFIEAWVNPIKLPATVHLSIDIDPQSFA